MADQPGRAVLGSQVRRWRTATVALLISLGLVGAFLVTDVLPRRQREARAAAAGADPTRAAAAADLTTTKAEVASCRQLARVAIGLLGEVTDAGIRHAAGHDALRKKKLPVGDPRTLQPGTVWGDYWGPTLRIIHHDGRPAKDAAEEWRKVCAK